MLYPSEGSSSSKMRPNSEPILSGLPVLLSYCECLTLTVGRRRAPMEDATFQEGDGSRPPTWSHKSPIWDCVNP